MFSWPGAGFSPVAPEQQCLYCLGTSPGLLNQVLWAGQSRGEESVFEIAQRTLMHFKIWESVLSNSASCKVSSNKDLNE